MDGRALIDVARELAAGSSEAYWRSSVGRAYYALLHEVLATLRHWGFSTPPRDRVHTFARLKLVYATDLDLKRIGLTLETLGRLRNAADYQLAQSSGVAAADGDLFEWDVQLSPRGILKWGHAAHKNKTYINVTRMGVISH